MLYTHTHNTMCIHYIKLVLYSYTCTCTCIHVYMYLLYMEYSTLRILSTAEFESVTCRGREPSGSMMLSAVSLVQYGINRLSRYCACGGGGGKEEKGREMDG